MRFLKKTRVTTPTVLQMEATECGAASLAMVLAYYGRFEPLEKLREDCAITRNGSKASLLLSAARSYGLKAEGYRALCDELDQFKPPMILYWDFSHFVVYEGRSRNGRLFYINDPAIGPRVLEREAFEASYTGVVLCFSPTAQFVKGGKPLNVVKSILPMLDNIKAFISAAIWGGLLMVFPGIMFPSLMQFFVDRILPGTNKSWLVPMLGFFLIAIGAQVLLAWLVSLALRRGTMQLAVNRTLMMFNHFFRLPAVFFSQRSVGDLQTRIDLNTSVANTTFGVVADNIVQLITAVFFFVMMLWFSPLLSLIVATFLVINIVLLRLITKHRQILSQSLLMLQTKLFSSIISGISLVETIRASGREGATFLHWVDEMAQMNSKRLVFQTSTTYFNLIPTLLTQIANCLVLCVGAKLVIDGTFTLGTLFAFQTLTLSFTMPVNALVMAGAEIQTLKADIDRIRDVYKYKPDDLFLEKPELDVPEQFESFELRHVTFGYSKAAEPLLKDVSMTLTPGKRIAFVGASGSGKSTLAKIASGTLKPWSGEVLLNGEPIAKFGRKAFYQMVGTVDQNIMLFSGTVEENLTLFAPEADTAQLRLALADACIHHELMRRGSILEQKIEEGGRNFSGGQCQRIEIARVFSYKTPLMILDEATSALDPVTEEQIDASVRERGCAAIVIAHRLSTVRDCDEILFLDKGRIVERGTHEQLMALGGQYAKMMRMEGAQS